MKRYHEWQQGLKFLICIKEYHVEKDLSLGFNKKKTNNYHYRHREWFKYIFFKSSNQYMTDLKINNEGMFKNGFPIVSFSTCQHTFGHLMTKSILSIYLWKSIVSK